MRCGARQIVELIHKDIDIGYLAIAIRKAVAGKGYGYEAKLFKGRVEQLVINQWKKKTNSTLPSSIRRRPDMNASRRSGS
jgi:hypothetical protein